MEPLTFTFIAEFFDGSIYKQDPFDKSRDGKGSSFGDIKDKKVKKFSLVGKGQVFTLDLIDGHLEVNGNKLYPPMYVWPGAKFELIYYRQVQQAFKTDYKQESKKNGILGILPTKAKIIQPVTRYYFGWSYLWKGKNHKWEMGID